MRTIGLVFVVSLICPCLASGQTWQAVTNSASATLDLPFLLTDGTVMVHDAGPSGGGSPNWVKLTPDQNGSYVNGTWSQLASLPAGYSPLAFASAVLADGRLVIIGGEYNETAATRAFFTDLGAVYDPRTNTWTPISAPPGWQYIGDAPSVVLPNGNFLVGAPTLPANSSQLASMNPLNLIWTVLPNTGVADSFDEEGFTLLPDGTFLTVDIPASPGAERYIPSMGQWVSAGSVPVVLADTTSGEMGPAVLRPDGTVFATGATGNTAIYIPPATLTGSGTWVAGPVFPNISGVGQLHLEDAPATLLPDGNVLVAASPGVYQSPTYFFEFNGTNLIQLATTPPDASNLGSYVYKFLLLPNGQVLSTSYNGIAEIYTPAPGSPNPAWAPTITTGPSQIGPGGTYTISGTQFNGLSQAGAYGDDYQGATNYPLVRITNVATGHVFYAKTHDHSTMAVATGSATVSTNFDVPAGIELGPSNLVVVANGIASASLAVTVATLKTSATALGSSLSPSLVEAVGDVHGDGDGRRRDADRDGEIL